MEFRIKTIKEAGKPDRYQPQVYGAPTSLASIPMPPPMYLPERDKEYSGGSQMSIWRDLVVYKYEIIAWDPFISSHALRDYMEKYPVQEQSWEYEAFAEQVIEMYKNPMLLNKYSIIFVDAPEVGKRSEYRNPIDEIDKRADRNFILSCVVLVLFIAAMCFASWLSSTFNH